MQAQPTAGWLFQPSSIKLPACSNKDQIGGLRPSIDSVSTRPPSSIRTLHESIVSRNVLHRSMRAKTELFLYRLHWLAEKPFARNFFDLSTSFEAWAYQGGFLRQIQRLEAQQLVDSQIDSRTGRRLYRLTEAGQRVARGGRDPVECWQASWDRKWRLCLFDIPEGHKRKRQQLTRALREAGCGCLQRSVWITACPHPELEKLIREREGDCSQLILLLADCKGLETDRQMVLAGWDFKRINQRYKKLSAVLDELKVVQRSTSPPEALRQWTEAEHQASNAALRIDPLLPTELLPHNYLGRKVWHKRVSVLKQAARISASLRQSGSFPVDTP